MKRKFASLLLVLIMCVSVFTGCSLVGRDDKAYFEAVVATITYKSGDIQEITKRELITAYNSYGYNYVDNYGYTKQEAVEETLETIINKKVTIRAVEEHYKNNPSEGKMLAETETTYLWDSTYEAVYANLKEYFDEVTGASTSEEEEESDSNASVYQEYSKNAYLELVDGQLVIKKTQPATTIRATYEARKSGNVAVDYEYKDAEGKYVFKESMYSKISTLFEASKSWRSAFNNYISDIKENYTYIDFKSDKEAFIFELDRVYNIMKENYLVEKYSAIYNMQNHDDAELASVTVDDILKAYSAKVRADYTKYDIEKDVETYASNMLSDIANMDYVIEGDGASNYFYVGYVKMNLDETQSAQLKNLKSQKESGAINAEQYNTAVDNIINSVYATKRDASTGEKTKETISAKNLLNKINNEIANYKYLTVEDLTEEQKADAEEEGVSLATYVEELNVIAKQNKAETFRKYLYLYNDDDTLKGADYNTVFGVDSSNAVLANDTFSSNDDAKNEILKLYKDGNAQVGDTTGLVEAEDGLYIFFYAGDVVNMFDDVKYNFDVSKQPESIKVLAGTKLNVFSNKTYFDLFYDELATDHFSVFQNMDINNLRTSLTTKIEAVENNIKDLYEE